MKPVYARLHVLLAREAPIGLVIRHGTAKSVCTLLWDRKKDRFTLGQWMRGQIHLDTCDLSPDGQHLLYSAQKYVNADSHVHSWTVVSRTPYLKAVAYYPRRWGGGWFVNDAEYCVPVGYSYEDDRESPEVRRVEAVDPPKISLYVARRTRDGWTVEDRRAVFGGRLELVRPAGAGWELRHDLKRGYAWEVRHDLKGAYRLSRGELEVETRGWDWADVDNKRLVWTSKGCLWAGMMRKHGLDEIELLHDFNGMKLEALVAPYEGGKPVRLASPQSVAAVAPPLLRRRSRKPARKKPNRRRVRPDEDP
jgi:hypothetical protein